MPAYIVAFVYTDILEFAGPVQGLLRDVFGWTSARDYWFPEIRSMGGAIYVMSFVLYPYVYLLAKASFQEQSAGLLEVARTLGHGPWQTFFCVALPLARPAIVFGIALALMETLADFGTVDFFAVNTLTRSVFNVWLGMGNAGGAAQIALVMLAFVLLVIGLERVGRRGRRYHQTSNRYTAAPGYELRGLRAACAIMACLAPIVIGFLIPAGVLLRHAVVFFDESWNASFLTFARNSLLLATLAALAVIAVAVFLAYGQRLSPSRGFAVLPADVLATLDVLLRTIPRRGLVHPSLQVLRRVHPTRARAGGRALSRPRPLHRRLVPGVSFPPAPLQFGVVGVGGIGGGGIGGGRVTRVAVAVAVAVRRRASRSPGGRGRPSLAPRRLPFGSHRHAVLVDSHHPSAPLAALSLRGFDLGPLRVDVRDEGGDARDLLVLPRAVSEQRVSLPCFSGISRDAGIVLIILVLKRAVFKVLEARVRVGPRASVPRRRSVRRDGRDPLQNLFTARSPLALCITRRAYSHLFLVRLVR